MSSPQMISMLGFLPAAGFCCASAAPEKQSAMKRSISFFMVTPSFFECKDFLPVGFHADDGPGLGLCLVPGLVQLGDVRGSVVGVLARRIVVMHEQREAPPGARGGELQHLEVAVGVAECGQRPTADDLLDVDRLAFLVV